MSTGVLKVLSLDGGGAKGVYTLGVLSELEAKTGKPLCELFDLIFGTSTGSIIASLIALGFPVDQIRALYAEHVPRVMKPIMPSQKTKALEALGQEIFGDKKFDAFKTDVGIVAANWDFETPMVFKSDVKFAYGRKSSFSPGFGVSIRDAVVASCSAYPFFAKKIVITDKNDQIELIDGGYCANNPTLYAIADAVHVAQKSNKELRILSIGCGTYPEPKKSLISVSRYTNLLLSVRLLQKTLEMNTKSMEQLRSILHPNVQTVRINERFSEPEMATDMFESDTKKLNLLVQRGRASFASFEDELGNLLEL
ncbi:patatin-like phospholipase family protein [Erythrobacter sp. Alg231-14]|uniref:patatin-like phospholipase family protein n=1 Tax=Erythrobacter sp. Alg231-14 TaxID=1922225 RepID=UPI000D55A545